MAVTGYPSMTSVVPEESSSSGIEGLAPEEQHVYSLRFLIYPAPLGAEWTKAHGAPLERRDVGIGKL